MARLMKVWDEVLSDPYRLGLIRGFGFGLIFVSLIMLMQGHAHAQQPATALQRCGSDVGNLAIHADDLSEQLDKAKLEIADLKKQLDEAKAPKSEKKK
jgi:hypothetical protein